MLKTMLQSKLKLKFKNAIEAVTGNKFSISPLKVDDQEIEPVKMSDERSNRFRSSIWKKNGDNTNVFANLASEILN